MDTEELFQLREIIKDIETEFPDTPKDQLLSIAVRLRTNDILRSGLGVNIIESTNDFTALEQIQFSLTEIENKVTSIEENSSDILTHIVNN